MACNFEIFLLVAAWFSLCFGKPATGMPHSTLALTNNGINPNHFTGPGISIPKIAYLYSRNTGKFVRIHQSSVDGAGVKLEKNAKLVIESSAFGGQVRIKSFIGNRYLCLSSHGSVVVEEPKQGQTLDRCVFIQSQVKGFTVFQSKINTRWYLGVRNNGEVKSAKKTRRTQRATHFLEF